MAREDRISVRCDFCGTIIWGDNEDELTNNFRVHIREQHDEDMSEAEIRDKIRASLTYTLKHVVR